MLTNAFKHEQEELDKTANQITIPLVHNTVTLYLQPRIQYRRNITTNTVNCNPNYNIASTFQFRLQYRQHITVLPLLVYQCMHFSNHAFQQRKDVYPI